MSENKNAYPIYYDASIKDDNIIISGMPDFKCGDPLCLINIDKMATGIVSEAMEYRYPGLYVGNELASQLVIDMDPGGDVVHVTKMREKDYKGASLDIQFESSDPDICKVIFEQMDFSLGDSRDYGKSHIKIEEAQCAYKHAANIHIRLDDLTEDVHTVSEKIGMAVQAVVEKYLVDLKDLKKLWDLEYLKKCMEDNKDE